MIKKQRHSVRLSCASSPASTRNARLFACSRALPHFSLSGYRFSLLYLHLFFFCLLSCLIFLVYPGLYSIEAVGIVSSFFFLFTVSRQVGLPASPRVLQKKGRGARREERNVIIFFFYKYRDRVPCDRHRPRSLSKKNCSRTQRNGSRAAPTSSGFLSRRLRG